MFKFKLPVSARSAQAGFSMIEMMVVLAIVVIMVGISIPFIVNYRKLYRSDDQAMKIMDLMSEASQLALARRRTMRFEVDLTDNAVLIIDENGAASDTLLKRVPLDEVKEVRVDVRPSGVARPDMDPGTPVVNYNDAAFATDSLGHYRGATNVTGHSVWAARFQSDGSVVNAAGTPISINLYVFPPATLGSTTPRNVREVRAITMFGGSGAIRFWKHNGTVLSAT